LNVDNLAHRLILVEVFLELEMIQEIMILAMAIILMVEAVVMMPVVVAADPDLLPN
jgi:hypothetical protein